MYLIEAYRKQSIVQNRLWCRIIIPCSKISNVFFTRHSMLDRIHYCINNKTCYYKSCIIYKR